ncbi:MAG: peptidyl-prolyl cis-trans isomerase, partial [Opitutales bacterium]
MITRIQNYLLRHHKWFFSALLVVIIVAFVLTIGNQSIGGNQTMEVERREYYGYDIDNPSVQRL